MPGIKQKREGTISFYQYAESYFTNLLCAVRVENGCLEKIVPVLHW